MHSSAPYLHVGIHLQSEVHTPRPRTAEALPVRKSGDRTRLCFVPFGRSGRVFNVWLEWDRIILGAVLSLFTLDDYADLAFCTQKLTLQCSI